MYPDDALVVIRGDGSALVVAHDGSVQGKQRLAITLDQLVKAGSLAQSEYDIVAEKLFGGPEVEP